MPIACRTAADLNGHRIRTPSALTSASNLERNPRSRKTSYGDDMAALRRITSRVRARRNETIFNEGDEAVSVYKVVGGVVRLCKHTSDGRRQVLGFKMPGDDFGFMQFSEYNVSAEAVNDVVLESYSRQRLDLLMRERPNLATRFAGLLSQQLAELHAHIILLGSQNAAERVTTFLLRLVARAGAERGGIFYAPMGQRDIADHLGLAVETVCRVFCELKRDRVIEPVGRNTYRLIDPGALELHALKAA